MTLESLREQYATGKRPSETIAEIYDRIEAEPLAPVWISLVPREAALARARELERDGKSLPLYGVPFAVKDNIDVAGVPTTAGCPDFAYQPERSATTVQRLVDAGAIPIGKTNLDQFATGLVGTRSPYGACSSVFDARYISGGSSSGSAVAVARGFAAFSLGTDTAGSGRVPAAFNKVVGLKPTRGVLSTAGVVPACRTLDCVSVFANNSDDALIVWKVAKGFDAADRYSRTARIGEDAAPWLGKPFRFGVPPASQLEFFGDEEAALLFASSVAWLEKLGGIKVEIDFAAFRAAAELLYQGPWVAERYAAIGEFLTANGERMNPVVRDIIASAVRYSAVDAFRAQYRLNELRRATEAEWVKMDVLFLPTTGTIYTHEQVAADPVGTNTNLGYYTNFVNLLDLAAVAVPAGMRSNNLPFGVSLIGPAFSEEALLALATRFQFGSCAAHSTYSKPGCVAVAVVGAHLADQPLHGQLTERASSLIKVTRTAPGYRLFALGGTVPPKPGLVLDKHFEGSGIEVEVYAMPEDQFGGFVAAVPPPLTIGSVVLEDGEIVKCFLVEPFAVAGATEITHFGGWRNYLAHNRSGA